MAPNSGDQALSAPPRMKVWVHGVSGAGATVRLYRRVSPPRFRPDFTVAVLPDTQHYSGSVYGGSPAIFNRQTEWIVRNRDDRNIAFVIHLGDLVEFWENEAEWVAANAAISRLENPITTMRPHGIPYSISVGNHEGLGDYPKYNQYFGAGRFSGRPYYGGHYGLNNNNHYSYFSAAGMDFIVLSLEYEAGSKPGVLAWANQILGSNVGRRAIVVSHSLLYPGVGGWNPAGLAIYHSIKGNSNVFMMLCGHDPQVARRTDTYNGNSIVSILSDYSNAPNGGNGWMRVMRFSPASNQIYVDTYSPWLNQYNTTPYWHQFSLPYNMAIPDPPYTLMNSVVVARDGIIDLVWTDLSPATSYDWYATVEDAVGVAKSATFNFATSSDLSLTKYPLLDGAPPFSEPLALEGAFQTASGYPAIIWKSKGGRRYRVEYRDETSLQLFTQIVRSASLETDPAPPGTVSYQVFVDDGTLTGGVSTSRVYQVREMAPVQPLRIIRIAKPVNGHPAIMWHSVGGRRYRVEYSNGGLMESDFVQVPRSQAAETDPAPEGSASFQFFVDDGTLTGGASSSRFYRVFEVP